MSLLIVRATVTVLLPLIRIFLAERRQGEDTEKVLIKSGFKAERRSSSQNDIGSRDVPQALTAAAPT